MEISERTTVLISRMDQYQSQDSEGRESWFMDWVRPDGRKQAQAFFMTRVAIEELASRARLDGSRRTAVFV